MRLKGGSGGGADPGAGCVPSPFIKWENARNHKFHQEKLAQMRASVDNRAPPRFKHLYVNAKKAQVEEDRLTEIEHQNRLLLHKLSRIAERRGVTGDGGDRNGKALQPGQACPKKSLNYNSRQTELNRIEADNAAILRRIQMTNNRVSEYSPARMEEEWKDRELHRKLASQFIVT